MRPVGDIARAMRQAAADMGPGTVRDLACRAQVGYDLARCTATRLVQRGDLVRVSDGRPMVLAVPPGGEGLGDALSELHRSFWEDSAEPTAADQGFDAL